MKGIMNSIEKEIRRHEAINTLANQILDEGITKDEDIRLWVEQWLAQYRNKNEYRLDSIIKAVNKLMYEEL